MKGHLCFSRNPGVILFLRTNAKRDDSGKIMVVVVNSDLSDVFNFTERCRNLM